MKRILVGVDGSPESRKAAEYAAQIARATGSGLELAHILPEIENPTPSTWLGPETSEMQRTERAHILLHEMSQGLSATSVETSLLQGSAAERLADEAGLPGIWMVVVGHRGRGSVQRAVLGSVADRLMQISPKPVLVVR